MELAPNTSGAVRGYLKRKGFPQRQTGEILDISQPEVSRIATGARDFTMRQLDALANHEKLHSWQLILRGLREIADPEQLNARVAQLAHELRIDLERLEAVKAAEQKVQSTPEASYASSND